MTQAKDQAESFHHVGIPVHNPPVTPKDSSKALLPDLLFRYRERLEVELRSALARSDLDLYQILRYHLGWEDEHGRPSVGAEGKAFRPALCLLSCQAAGGTLEIGIPAAAAVELMHNFSLIHDDIQDQDRERHHRATVWALWGKPEALNAGNALRIVADMTLMKLAEHGLPMDRLLRASNLLVRRCLQMIEGQYLDLSFENRLDVSTAEYREMIASKTGALISCAMELGAMVGPNDTALTSILSEVSRYLGFVYQVRDDILGIWGQESATGKPRGSDIRRKKKTYPIVYALQHATGTAKATLSQILQKESIADDDVSRAMDILEELNARDEAQALAARMSEKALETLRRADMPPALATDFEGLIAFLLLRES